MAEKKAHSPSALPQEMVATSEILSRPLSEITDNGTSASRVKVSAMPTMMALGNFSGLSAKPRAISGTIYCAEKQNATTLKTGTIYSQLPSSR